MSVSSLEYILVLFLIASIFFRLPERRPRQFAFALGGAGFFFSHVADPRSMLVMLGFLLSGYGCARLLLERPSRLLFASYLVLLVGIFTFLKRYAFLSPLISQSLIDLRLDWFSTVFPLFST
jgi:hypothetical protein